MDKHFSVVSANRIDRTFIQPRPPPLKMLYNISPRLRKYKPIIENTSQIFSSIDCKPMNKTKFDDIEILNQLCNQLLKEQQELKEQLKQQEDEISFMRSSQRKSRKEPLKLFQIAVVQLEKQRKSRILSLSRSMTPNKQTINQKAKKLDLSFSTNTKADNLVTFRSGQGWNHIYPSRKQFHFPRDVFSRQIKKAL